METVETQELTAPVAGAVVRVDVAAGDAVRAGDELLVVESMKTEFAVVAPADGTVVDVVPDVGVPVEAGAPVLTLRPGTVTPDGTPAPSDPTDAPRTAATDGTAGAGGGGAGGPGAADRDGRVPGDASGARPGGIRPDLAEVRRRRALTRDAASWLDVPTFHAFARLSGTVPLVGVASGRCFAGNAALLGCCDVVVATEDATIGMGGPAMIEGGGLGVHAPEEVGPIDVMEANGVVDVTVADEEEAVAVAREVLSFFQGPVSDWRAGDPRVLRDVVPERRVRAYDVRRAIEGIADVDGWIELRPAFGTSMVTALVRIEGRPYGLIANDPSRLGGAIDSAAADKAARFLGLCDAHGLPVVALCDTPGFMVGPEAERTGTVRHVSRMFVAGANLTVPLVTIVLRKAYGLGAMAMAGGSMKAPLATVGWPTAEMGAMGLEGAVRLGVRAELEAVADPADRQALFDRMVEAAYEHGKGLNAASMFELDDVIDPADTRRWIVAALGDHEPRRPGPGGGPDRRPFVDPW